MFRHVLTHVLIFTILFPYLPHQSRLLPSALANPEEASATPSTGLQTWVVPNGQDSAQKIANSLQATLQGLKESTGEDYAVVYTHLSTSNDNPKLLDAMQELQNRGITVVGSVVSPEEMMGKITDAVAGPTGMAAALNVKVNPWTIRNSVGRFLKKCVNLTYWTHVKKWKTEDWDRTDTRGKVVRFGYALLAGAIAAAWFVGSSSATGHEAEFVQEFTDASAKLIEFDGITNTLLAAKDTALSLGHLHLKTLLPAGLLTLWVVGYQTFFTAINSFRRQWVSPRFDPLKPAGQQLVLGSEQAYSRIFFFLASTALEMLICTAMMTIFAGGHINGTLLWVSLYTSIYSAMSYMPAETLAGTFNQRSARAQALQIKHLEENGQVMDELAQVLSQAAGTNKTLEIGTRYLWWDTLYPAMRYATLLGASGRVGNFLQRSFIGFFVAGTAFDIFKTRGALGRRIMSFVRRLFGRDTTAIAPCSDMIEFRALTQATE